MFVQQTDPAQSEPFPACPSPRLVQPSAQLTTQPYKYLPAQRRKQTGPCFSMVELVCASCMPVQSRSSRSKAGVLQHQPGVPLLPLLSGIPALHSHSHWQPCSCLVSRFRVPSQLNTNSIKKKKKKKQLLIFSQCRFLNQFPVQSLPAKGRKRRKDAEKGGGPTFYRLGCCGNTQTPHFKFQLASTAECDYFNQFFPKIKPYSNLCRNLSSHSLLGHKKQEVRPVHFINHIHPSHSIKQRASVSLT